MAHNDSALRTGAPFGEEGKITLAAPINFFGEVSRIVYVSYTIILLTITI